MVPIAGLVSTYSFFTKGGHYYQYYGVYTGWIMADNIIILLFTS